MPMNLPLHRTKSFTDPQLTTGELLPRFLENSPSSFYLRHRLGVIVAISLLLACTLQTPGQAKSTSASWDNTTQNKVRDYRRRKEHEILREFVQLLSIPNVASDTVNIRRNAGLIVEMMKRRELNPKLLESEDRSAPPAVYGEWIVPGAQRTVVLYAHYDGQPTDPRQWSGTEPWSPTLRSGPIESGGKILPFPENSQTINPEWRLYARSASDDKAGVMAILAAVDALRANGIKPTTNIKIFLDGEEEAGSPHIAEILVRHRLQLEADVWVICDGPVHQSGRKQAVFGVRGDTNVDLTVYAAKRPLHSGHYGNWSPNPAMVLSRLLASMKDDTGRVTIAGWYDDVEPLGAAEKSAIAGAPQFDDELKKQLGLAATENQPRTLVELINEPSLNINGMSSGDVGALARNVIPTTATAVLDLRLVKGNDYQRQVDKLINHVRRQGFYVTDREPTDDERLKFPKIAKLIHRSGGYNAERTAMDLPVSRAVIEALQATTAEPIVTLPTAGGSLPLSVITSSLRTVTITVPIANYDNNQHAENESIRLQNLWDGIETIAAMMLLR